MTITTTDPQVDWLSRLGAEQLAYHITRVWAKHGFSVKTNIRPVSGMPGAARAAHGSAWEVRSDLTRGLPRYRLDGTKIRD